MKNRSPYLCLFFLPSNGVPSVGGEPISPGGNDAAIPKCYVRYIIKLQSSHRSWCRDVKVKTFPSSSPSCLRQLHLKKANFFYLDIVTPAFLRFLWSLLWYAFQDHKFHHFFTHKFESVDEIFASFDIFAGLDKTFHPPTPATSVAWHFYVCKYRWDGEKGKKVYRCLMVESEKYAQHLNEDFQTFKLFVAFLMCFALRPHTLSLFILQIYCNAIVLISDTLKTRGICLYSRKREGIENSAEPFLKNYFVKVFLAVKAMKSYETFLRRLWLFLES